MNLSEEQIKPIASNSKNKLILAGPGTGKSYTILGFVIDLINNKSVNPSTIIVLTFTRAAAAELKNKIRDNINSSRNDAPRVFTLHGFSLRQLMKNSRNIKNLPDNFVIADDYEERRIIYEDIKRALKIPHIDDVRNLFKLLAANWQTLNADRTEWVTSFDNPAFVGLWEEHRAIYGYVLRSELVYQFKNLLTQEPDANIDGPINYLIVDEYQDLNKCDLLVISKLEERGSQLFCAGDDDQSIYGRLRFAEPEGIREFSKDIPSSEQFLIKECRRCDKLILDFALKVIRQDYRRIPKDLISVTGNQGEYHILYFKNQINEAKKVAETILALNQNKGIPFDDIIILLRNDKNGVFSKELISKLKDCSIPVSSSFDFYKVFNNNNGQYLIALFKYLKNNENDLAIRTLIQLTHGIGEVTIDAIYTYAVKMKARFSKVLSEINLGNIIEFKSNKTLSTAISEILSYNNRFGDKEKPFEEMLNEIFTVIPSCNEIFIENVREFVKEFEINSINDFIVTIIESLGPDDYDNVQSSGIRIMTMHKAKGLSASAVFVIGVEEENIPGKGSIEEERRLLYVSLTRARNYLFMTYCRERQGPQRYSGNLPTKTTRRNLSSYLKNIPNVNPEIGENFIL
jgi:DNA helicase-2/ATP-dependent DNA helicase PcrA